jgi:hypothetical protein
MARRNFLMRRAFLSKADTGAGHVSGLLGFTELGAKSHTMGSAPAQPLFGNFFP